MASKIKLLNRKLASSGWQARSLVAMLIFAPNYVVLKNLGQDGLLFEAATYCGKILLILVVAALASLAVACIKARPEGAENRDC